MSNDSVIVIALELDKQQYDKEIKQLEKESIKVSEVVGDSFNDNLGKTFNAKTNKEIEKTTISISKLTKNLSDAVGAISVATTGIIIIEKRFGLVSKAGEKLGVDVKGISSTLDDLKGTLTGFAAGEASFNKVKIAAAAFLQELGIIDSKLLRLVTFAGRLGDVGVQFFGLVSAAGAFSVALLPIARNLKSIGQTAVGVSSVLLSSKGLFGLTSTLSVLSVGLLGVSEALLSVENSFAKASGATLKFTSIALGGLAAALGFAIVKVSELSQSVGSNLVGFFQSASNSFNKASGEAEIFAAFVKNFNDVAAGGIGTLQSYNSLINELSTSFNIGESSLRKASQEIIQVGSQLGLQEEQLKKLIRVTAEYAKINKKDVFDTSVAVVSGLQGQSQALQTYGVKLNEAAVQAFAYKNGVDKSLRSLTDAERVQVRYNKLLDSFKKVSGIAAVAAGGLADQQKRLEQNQKRISTALGAGARIIEDNNLLAAIYNKVLDGVSDSVLKLTGFLGALGSRVLQIGGLILGLSFKFFAVTKAVKILDIALRSQAGINAFAANIPFINKSLNDLLGNFSKTTVKVNSLKTVFTALTLGVTNGLNAISTALFGVSVKALTFGKVFTGIFSKARVLLARFIPLVAKLAIAFAPLVLKITLVVGAFNILKKAFEIIEKETKIFTTTFDLLKKSVSQSSSVLAPVIEAFTKFGTVVINVANKAFGLFVDKLSSVFSFIAGIVSKNPFGVFEESTIKTFSNLKANLDGFRAKLLAADFDIQKLSDSARNIAGDGPIIPDVNIDQLQALKQEFEDFGKTDLEKLEENQTARLDLINNALQAELLSFAEFEELKNNILQDGATKRFNLLNKAAIQTSKQISRTLQGGLVRVVQSAAAKIGEALAGGSFSFKAFVGTILGIIGDLLLQLSGAFLAIGLGVEAIKASVVGLSAGPALAAGLALALLGGALKAFSSSLGGEQTGGSSVNGGVSGGGGGGFSSSQDVALTEDQERAEPETRISLTIQGDVLDSDESGLKILELLNKELDTSGSVITGLA